jgi:hypothetical protein
VDEVKEPIQAENHKQRFQQVTHNGGNNLYAWPAEKAAYFYVSQLILKEYSEILALRVGNTEKLASPVAPTHQKTQPPLHIPWQLPLWR